MLVIQSSQAADRFGEGLTGASLRVVLGGPPAAHDSQSRGALQFLPVRGSIPIARCRQGAHYSASPPKILPVGRGERRPTFERKPLSEVVPLRAPPKQTAQPRAKVQHPGWAE